MMKLVQIQDIILTMEVVRLVPINTSPCLLVRGIVNYAEKKVEFFDIIAMDLIGGINKRPYHEDNTTEQQHVRPELGLSLKRCVSGSLEKNQDESKHQKLISLADASTFSRYEKDKPVEKAVGVVVEASSSGEPKTPKQSHEKLLRRCDQGSAKPSSNHKNIGSPASFVRD
ncbi:unnamed protein product [Eruca vesicaria subsp. sativa]|uniref:Uncharacterized protein n=1 Tax=Eruca vesicaria subsp. sativa TaxID=29727 RepID=A0ABC8KLY4_ERUVS|nr:unnamed protein product [Eruca vesicaria subsp. sativa]